MLRIGHLTKDLMRFVHRLQYISHGGVTGETAWFPVKHWDQRLCVRPQALHITRAVSVRFERVSVPRKHTVAQLRNSGPTCRELLAIKTHCGWSRRHFDVFAEKQVWQLQRPKEVECYRH